MKKILFLLLLLALSCNMIRNKIVLFVPAHSCNVCYDEVYDALKYSQDIRSSR